ncbi:MAG TPA: hypothetical protein VIX60_09645 [Candidatus Cybelea sp.]
MIIIPILNPGLNLDTIQRACHQLLVEGMFVVVPVPADETQALDQAGTDGGVFG